MVFFKIAASGGEVVASAVTSGSVQTTEVTEIC
jgi:hypothetical protein